MPSPRDRIKLTGDTHPPEVEFDLGADDGPVAYDDANLVMDQPAAPQAVEAQPQQRPEPARGRQGYLNAAREQVRSRPVPALLGAFVLGLLLARL